MFGSFLNKKKGIIMGIANNWSIAYGVAKFFRDCGVHDVILTYPNNDGLERRVRAIAEEFGFKHVVCCDVASDESIKQLFDYADKEFGSLDFIVHSVAFANKNSLSGDYYDTSRTDFLEAMNISCFSLTSLVKHAIHLMKDRNASILTMSYYGANKVIPFYNVMGVCKAALESSVRYLANDVGKHNIRVNAISAGPIKTLAANGINEFRNIFQWCSTNAPLRRATTLDDIARTAAYLISELASGVTGEVLFVDSGYNTIGMQNSTVKQD
ncbi:enoyl-ACP reductase [Anaplasmataceae bacterium AB001_6]|nr:enoyl-ACP reductase [Anaplasmataceae bacterium AB001_6]